MKYYNSTLLLTFRLKISSTHFAKELSENSCRSLGHSFSSTVLLEHKTLKALHYLGTKQLNLLRQLFTFCAICFDVSEHFFGQKFNLAQSCLLILEVNKVFCKHLGPLLLHVAYHLRLVSNHLFFSFFHTQALLLICFLVFLNLILIIFFV